MENQIIKVIKRITEERQQRGLNINMTLVVSAACPSHTIIFTDIRTSLDI